MITFDSSINNYLAFVANKVSFLITEYNDGTEYSFKQAQYF